MPPFAEGIHVNCWLGEPDVQGMVITGRFTVVLTTKPLGPMLPLTCMQSALLALLCTAKVWPLHTDGGGGRIDGSGTGRSVVVVRVLCCTNVCWWPVAADESVVCAVMCPLPVPCCVASVVVVVTYVITLPFAVVSVLVVVAPPFSTCCVGPPVTLGPKPVVWWST